MSIIFVDIVREFTVIRLMMVALFASPALATDAPAPVNARVTAFELINAATGQPWRFIDETREAKATVLLFLNTACPVSNAYVPRIIEIYKARAGDGVVFAAIFSAETDTPSMVKQHAKDYVLPFAAMTDTESKLAATFGLERLPTVLVLDATRTVRYAGRIDDQFAPGAHRAKATTRELADAIDAVLKKEEVKVPFAPPAGCKLTRATEPRSSAITYHKHIAPIVQKRCQDCHRAGEAGPFALDGFKSAKGWSGMIREVVENDQMPPWNADAPHGYLKNDRRLTADEKTTMLTWLDAGCPEGNPADAPTPRTFIDGWRLGREPDEVLTMKKSVTIPATTTRGMPYSYVEVGEPFKEDKWVTAVEVRPGFRPAIHHIIAFIIPPGGTFFDIAGDKFGANMLGAYVPGDQPVIAPPGMARKIAKGSRILFELHYTPMGKAGVDRSMVGLCYSKEPPKHEIIGDAIFNGRLQIPAGDPAYQVTASKTFHRETVLLAMAPHMHVRGKSFAYDLKTPDGKTERLLNVPKYDFNWQVSYELAKPRTIPAGSRIICTALFDNSEKNPFNPDPTKSVRWGQQTWQEMMIGFLTFQKD